MSTSNVLGKGRTALVTGASLGIGPLIARELANHGGHVVLTSRSAVDLKAVAAELAAADADVSFIPADLTEPGAAQAWSGPSRTSAAASTCWSTTRAVTRCASSSP